MEFEIQTLQAELASILTGKFALSHPTLLAITDLPDLVQTVSLLRIKLNENQNLCVSYKNAADQAITANEQAQQDLLENQEITQAARQKLTETVTENVNLSQKIRELQFQLKEAENQIQSKIQQLEKLNSIIDGARFNSEALQLIQLQEKSKNQTISTLQAEIDQLKQLVTQTSEKDPILSNFELVEMAQKNAKIEAENAKVKAENAVFKQQNLKMQEIFEQGTLGDVQGLVQEKNELVEENQQLKEMLGEFQGIQRLLGEEKRQNELQNKKIEEITHQIYLQDEKQQELIRVNDGLQKQCKACQLSQDDVVVQEEKFREQEGVIGSLRQITQDQQQQIVILQSQMDDEVINKFNLLLQDQNDALCAALK